MKILDLILCSGGRPWAQVFLMSNDRYYKRVVREDTQGSTKTVWLCGGFGGEEPFAELPKELCRGLEATYQTWLAARTLHIAPPIEHNSRRMLPKVPRLSLGISLSWVAAISVLDSKVFPAVVKIPLSAITAFSVGYTAGSFKIRK